MKKIMNIKCRNWEIQISNVYPDGYMSGWLEYVGTIIPGFGSAMSFCVEQKNNGKIVISADNPEYIPEYLEKKIKAEYVKTYGAKG